MTSCIWRQVTVALFLWWQAMVASDMLHLVAGDSGKWHYASSDRQRWHSESGGRRWWQVALCIWWQVTVALCIWWQAMVASPPFLKPIRTSDTNHVLQKIIRRPAWRSGAGRKDWGGRLPCAPYERLPLALIIKKFRRYP